MPSLENTPTDFIYGNDEAIWGLSGTDGVNKLCPLIDCMIYCFNLMYRVLTGKIISYPFAAELAAA